MNKIIIYSGRFQPFGPHHYEVYKWLCKNFDPNFIFIVTSNSITRTNPLNFLEKKAIIGKFGIPSKHIVCCESVYSATELLENFNASENSAIFVYGEKDAGRINFIKQDGSASYFTKYFGQSELQPFSQRGYILIAPNFTKLDFLGNEISGTSLRQILPTATEEQFKTTMGWYDKSIHKLFIKKFIPNLREVKVELNEDRITKTQLQRIEQYADKLFKEFGIDIEFQNLYSNTHFYQRLNDPRNITPITTDELRQLFIKASRKYGDKLSSLNSGAEGVLKDMETDINLPFLIKWDNVNKELDLIPKTIMRKKDFKTNTPEYTIESFKQIFNEIQPSSDSNLGKYTKHIIHPFEAPNFTFKELKDFYGVVCLKPDKIVSTLKLDGQNLQVTFKDGRWKAARNKSTILNPLTVGGLAEMFKDRGDLGNAFVDALKDIDLIFNAIPMDYWPDFNNGLNFINLEILNPKTRNLFKQYDKPTLSIHGINCYDSNGNEINRMIYNPKINMISGSVYDCIITPKCQLNPIDPKVYTDFIQRLNQLMEKCSLTNQSKVESLYKSPFKDEFEVLIHSIGNQIIKCNVNNGKVEAENINYVIGQLINAIESINYNSNVNVKNRFISCLEKLKALGGMSSINPIEGFVFYWNGMQLKITGSFSYVNQMIGSVKYAKS